MIAPTNMITGKPAKLSAPAPSKAQLQAYWNSVSRPDAVTSTKSGAAGAAQPPSVPKKGVAPRPRIPLWVKLVGALAGIAAVGGFIGLSHRFKGPASQVKGKKEKSRDLSLHAKKKSKKEKKSRRKSGLV